MTQPIRKPASVRGSDTNNCGDLSEEACRKRVRDHPQSPHNHREVMSRGHTHFFRLGIDMMASLIGVPPKPPKQSKNAEN